jgi:hypothetical protein
MRFLAVVAYQLSRAFGRNGRARDGLLIHAGGRLRFAALVRQRDGRPFDLPGRGAGTAVSITPRKSSKGQLAEYRKELLAREKGDGTGAQPSLLLWSQGHARIVTSIEKPAKGEVWGATLGPEWLQGPAPQPSAAGQPDVEEPELQPRKAVDELPEAGSIGGIDPATAALALYTEAGQHVRALIDVRFKLLALVPAVSALALVGIVSPNGPLKDASPLVRIAAALAGFAVVLGIRVYDLRNSELHDDLISRARLIEHQMGITRGVYIKRRKSVWPIEHGVALHLVYGAVLLAWLAAAIAPVLMDL